METNKKRLTIDDIARLAGVSPTAVSFVINDRGGVSAATREKVNAVISITGFRPNATSRKLSFQKSFNIALIYPSSASPFSDFFYYEIAKGLTEKLSEVNYNVVFAALSSNGNKSVLPNILLQRDADGAIFLQDMDPSLLFEMDGLEIPYLLIDIHTPDKRHTHISVDSEKSIYMAVKYLISHGHTTIAFLGSDALPSNYIQCLSGYQKALTEVGLSIQPAWIQRGAYDQQSTDKCMDTILNCEERPTAICCMGDIHAIEAIALAKNRGIAVPGELSFISIDDIILSAYTDPPLTTVGYDKQSMGRTAAEMLLGKINGQTIKSIIVDSERIIERKSVSMLNPKPMVPKTPSFIKESV